MKKRSILLSGLFALTMCLAGCSDDEQPDPQLPPLVWPDDVATAIPDERFVNIVWNGMTKTRTVVCRRTRYWR